MADDPVRPQDPSLEAESAGQEGAVGRVPSAYAVLTGLAIGTVLCVLNILVTFRTGAAFGGSALVALLGAGILKLFRRLSWPHLFIVFSIASSGYLATAALDSGIAALYVTTGSIPPVFVLLIAAFAANVAGIALGVLLAQIFVQRERLPYPTLQPAISFMTRLVRGQGASVKVLIWSALAAGIIAGVATVSGHDTVSLYPGAPQYLSVALSPLLVGTGALIGWRSARWLLVGAVFSMGVWAARDGVANVSSYSVHLTDRWILPSGVGIIVGYALTSLLRMRVRVRSSVADTVGELTRRRVTWGVVPLCVLATGLLVWRQGVASGLAIGTLAIVLTFAFGLFLCRAGGEIGIAPLAPVLYLSVIAFGVAAELTTALLAAAIVSCAGIAAVYYTYAHKVALAGADGDQGDQMIPRRHIIGSQLVGSIVGSLAGVIAIVAVIRTGTLGGSSFPAPLASSVSYLTTVTGHHHGPGHTAATLPIAGVAALLGAGLAFTSAVPTSLGLGILLPPAYALAMTLGGALRWLVTRNHPDRKSFVETTASGLVIGEGIVITVAVAVQVLSP